MVGIFGDRGRGAVLRVLCAAGAGDYPRERNAWYHRADRTDFVAPGNGNSEPGVPGFEINNYIAVAAGPGERGEDGSVHRPVGNSADLYLFGHGVALC